MEEAMRKTLFLSLILLWLGLPGLLSLAVEENKTPDPAAGAGPAISPQIAPAGAMPEKVGDGTGPEPSTTNEPRLELIPDSTGLGPQTSGKVPPPATRSGVKRNWIDQTQEE